MILGTGSYMVGLSEKQMSMVLDALDMAMEKAPTDSPFTRAEFADLGRDFQARFDW